MDAGLAAPTGDDALGEISGWSGVALVMVVVLVELALLQAFSVGVTTGIYYLVPLLNVGEPKGFEDWRSIFQVASPTLTLPGGGVIVLSIYLMARRAQQAERRAAAAEANAAKAVAAAEANVATAVAAAEANAATAVAAAKEQAAAAQAKVAELQTELERRPRRRRRRSLR